MTPQQKCAVVSSGFEVFVLLLCFTSIYILYITEGIIGILLLTLQIQRGKIMLVLRTPVFCTLRYLHILIR